MPQGIDPPRCGSRRLPSPFPDEIVGRCAPSIVNIKALPAETRADACERPLTRRWSMFVTPQIQSWPPRTVRKNSSITHSIAGSHHRVGRHKCFVEYDYELVHLF